MTENNHNDIHHLNIDDKEVILLGTAHVSKESAELVTEMIHAEKPDTVCIELCQSRYQSIKQQNKWQEMDIIKVIKEKKAFLLLTNLLLASFQKRVAKKLDIKPGEEMLRAIDAAEEENAEIYLADRDIRITLSRVWRTMGLKDKIKLIFQLVMSLGEIDEITEEEVERMKEQDVLQSLLSEVEKSLPVLRNILIDERDQYLASKIKAAPGKKIIAVVGAGHVPGIKKYWETDSDIKALEQLPPKGKSGTIIKWVIPSIIIALFAGGFYYGGAKTGTDMIWWWFLANGILAGIGATIALAHPYTIISSILAAPLTSLNPMVAAGWVSGLVEAFSRKPKVKDLESLSEDIHSIRGFWRNKVTRILLVVLFTNLGSSIGTMVALPMMIKLL